MAKNGKKAASPAMSKRLGQIRVTVWRNESDEGKVFFNTTCVRRYAEGSEWKDVTSFTGLGDVTLAIEALHIAKDFIAQQEESEGDVEAP
jgi:hypothetical protein